MAWSRNQTSILLDEYERHPILYDTKNYLYYNKGARTGALQQILDEVIKVRPNTTVEMIKMKLNTLRTQFNKEMNILKTKLSTTETNYHNVSLWCFTRMMFLKDYLSMAKTSSIDLSKLQLAAKTETEHSQENRVDISENGESQQEPENIGHQEQECLSSVSSNESESFRNNKKRKRNEHIADIRSTLSKQDDDEWDVFTKFITSEIKTIKSERRKNRMKREIITLILKNQEEEEAEEEEFEMN